MSDGASTIAGASERAVAPRLGVIRAPLGVWITDLTVLLFGLWTVLCQSVVAFGGTPIALTRATWVVIALVPLALAAAAFVWGPRSLGRRLVDADTATLPPTAARATGTLGWLFPLLFASGALLILWDYADHGREDRLGFWATGLFGVACIWSVWRDPPGAMPLPGPLRGEWLLLPVALGISVFTMCARRPDSDEAFYLALAATLLRNPDVPLMSFDPVHGVLDWPLQVLAYRSHSYELLAGVLSRMTGVVPVTFTHIVFPGFWGALVPFAWSRLFRELWPDRALLCTLLTIVVILSDGTSNQSYGNFAMVRMYQGKAILLTAMVPLLAAYSIRLVRDPSGKRLLLLLAAQAGATGLSSIAIPLGPLVVGIAALATLPVRGASRRLSWALAGCAYPLALGAMFYAQMKGMEGVGELSRAATKAAEVAVSNQSAADGKLALLHKVFKRVLTNADIRWAYLGALCLLPVLGRTPALRRLAAVAGLVFFGLLANPYLQPVVAGHLFGSSTYWRIFWVLPLPAFVAALAVSVTHIERPRLVRIASTLSAVAAIAWVAYTLPNRATFTSRNRTGYDVPPAPKRNGGYYLAKYASRYAPAGSTVIGPRKVTTWLGAFPKPVYGVFVKRSYLRDEHKSERQQLSRCFVKYRRRGCHRARLVRGLKRLNVGAVVFKGNKKRKRSEHRYQALDRAGFKLRKRSGRMELWAR